MMKLKFCSGVFFLLLAIGALLSGCADRTFGSVSHLDVMVNGNEAIVMVAVDSDVNVITLASTNKLGGVTGHYWLFPPYTRNGFQLIKVPIGHEFAINEVAVETGSSFTESHARFRDAKRIKIERHGLYFYGSVYIRNDKVQISYQIDNGLIKLAKERHKIYFDRLETINF